MLKKLCSFALAGSLIFSSVGVSFAADSSSAVQNRLAAIEADTYGAEQTGAVIDRLNRLERDYDGSHRSGSLMSRIDAIYDEVYTNSSMPSVLTSLNAVEWNIDHEVSMRSVQQRVSDLESSLFGKTSEGTFIKRIANLSTASFGSDTIPIEQTSVPANTLVKIALAETVNAKNIKVGDVVKYQVAEDVVINNVLVFAKGSRGEGTVKKVSQAKNFGRNATVEIDFNKTKAIDGTFVGTFVGEEAKMEIERMGMAAGASLAGIVLLGPIGIVAGAFVKGKNVELPAGTELYVQTQNAATLYGVATTTTASSSDWEEY